MKVELVEQAYLLDTQIISYFGNKHPFIFLYEDILLSEATLFISLQSKAEIFFGAKKANWGDEKIKMLGHSLKKYRILIPQLETAIVWADLMAHSRKIGRSLSAQDAWIAATAIYFDLTLVSHDVDFFSHAGLRVIRRGY